MPNIIVDIADAQYSSDPDDVIVTYSLGSCIGVGIYDPVAKVGGMIHCMLPVSSVDSEKARQKPYMFVDSGMTLFLAKLFGMGVTRANAAVKVAGAAKVLDKSDLFRIGERNYTIFRKILWKNGMMIKAEHVGGEISRTVYLEMSTGKFTIRSQGKYYDI